MPMLLHSLPAADSGARADRMDAWSIRLPLSDWVLRVARGEGRRPALEVYSPDGFVDVSVPTEIGGGVLRGTRRGTRHGRVWALAWGQIPGPVQAGSTSSPTSPRMSRAGCPDVVFRRWRQERPVAPVQIHDRFWVAEVEGAFRSVVISSGPALVRARLATS